MNIERKDVLEWDPLLATPLVRMFEGLRLKAYLCPAGKWTIGYGHTKGVKEGQVITKAKAEEYLLEDLQNKQDVMASMIHVPVTEGQFIALLSFYFNVRLSSIRSGNVWRLMNAGKTKEAGELMLKYINKDSSFENGLRRRREAEHKYFVMEN